MRFKIGDIVKISKHHWLFTEESTGDPINTEGIIYNIDDCGGLSIKVKWNDNLSNNYTQIMLELVRRPNET